MTQHLFALKRGANDGTGYYCNFYPTEMQVRMCIDLKNPEPILLVSLEEDESGRYWG